MAKPIEKFIEKLLSHPKTVIVLCNILNGHRLGLFGVNFVQELIDWWAALYVWQIKTKRAAGIPLDDECTMLLGSLDRLIFEASPAGFRTSIVKPDFLLKCAYRPINTTKPISYLHTLNAEFVFRDLLRKEIRDKLASTGFITYPPDPGRYRIKHVKLSSNDFDSRKYKLGRDGYVIFITPADGIKKIMKKTKAADSVRDSLGLIEKHVGVDLVAIEFTCSTMNDNNHARPTIGDAGSYRRFKTLADNVINQKETTWGFTADLEKFAATQSDIDGMPERVSLPIPFSQLENIKLVNLGKVTDPRGNLIKVDDDSSFQDKLLASRNLNKINLEILKLL